MMENSIETKKYIPALDGLRGFATILVVAYHYLAVYYPFFSFGWCGIELFFVLSGFLISSRLLPYLHQKGAIKKFYWNRFLRIVPLYFMFLIIFFLGWFLFTSANTKLHLPFYTNHWCEFFLFIQNWVYIFDFSQNTNHLEHLWSLAVEEQIYLVYPIYCLLFIKNKYIIPITTILIIILVSIRILYYFETLHTIDYKQIYWNTFFRVDSFLCGVITYQLYIIKKNSHKKIVNIVGAITILVLITSILIIGNVDKSNPFFTTIGRTLIAISFSYLMWSCLKTSKNIFLQIFSSKRIVFFGKISYGIFIFHWPIFLTGFTIINKVLKLSNYNLRHSEILFLNALFSFTITIIISALSFKYYESYFLKWKAR